MKRIITAIGSQELNRILTQSNSYEIISNDIQYQEALIEILEKRKDVNILILSELLAGDMNITEFVVCIKKIVPTIQIILFLEKENQELRNCLISKGVFKIYINNELSINEIIKIINNIDSNINEEITEEIERLKEIIIKNNLEKEKNNKINIEKIKNKFIKNKEKIEAKTICISGTYESGKSIICACLGIYLKNENIKTVIIDFDIFNSSINTIFGVKKYPKNSKNNNVENLIIKINKNLDLICAVDLLFNNENKIENEKVKKFFNKLKGMYDVILIDTSSETYLKYTKLILNNSDKIIFLVEPNILEIKKAKNLINIYVNEWNVTKEKLNVVVNKVNINSIEENILKNIFSETKIIGRIYFDNKYNLIINKNINEIYLLNKKQYKEIKKEILNC